MPLASCLPTRHRGFPSERKAIDPSDQLGSFYDINSDCLVRKSSVSRVETKLLKNHPVDCQLLFGQDSKTLNSYLEYLYFHATVQRNILTNKIQAHGITRCLLDYDRTINQKTCFLYYSYRHRQEKILVKHRKAEQVIPYPKEDNFFATHVITKVVWGFEFLLIISLINDLSFKEIDFLEKIKRCLNQQKTTMKFNSDEEQLLSTMTDVKIYGTETYLDNATMPLATFLSSIQTWQTKTDCFQPITYIMQPLTWLYGLSNRRLSSTDDENYLPLESIPDSSEDFNRQIRELEGMFEQLKDPFTSDTLNELLADQQKTFQPILDAQNESSNTSPNHNIHCLQDHVKNLLSKKALIDRLKKDQISYVHLYDICSRTEINNQTIANIDSVVQKHIINDKHDLLVWYSSDHLKNEQADRWEQFYQHFLTQQTNISHETRVELIYLDLSDVQVTLEKNDIVHLSRCLPSASALETSDINVLIIGETGVGKSTFINALANYLTFDHLEQAEENEPKCLIPVSFTIITDPDSDGVAVRYGPPDANEDQNKEGRSWTQKCRSYVFNLGENKRLRFIDTPGLGDTGGVEKDRQTMDVIFSYINNYRYINAICFLCAPDTSRLTIAFRYCIQELLTRFPNAIHSHIGFCFTNSRTTFYSPGQTGTLIKAMFDELNNSTIRFTKTNHFCFDNETFRYLIARRAGVHFDEAFRRNVLLSWNKSSKESKYFLDYLRTMTPIDIHASLSIRQIHYEVMKLARPLMETLRLILYNWRLHENNIQTHRIIIQSRAISMDLCSRCAIKTFVNVSPFWIGQYQMPISSDIDPSQQICQQDDHDQPLIESIIEHQSVPKTTDESMEYSKESLREFINKCELLMHYLSEQKYESAHDLINRILDEFIEEEESIKRDNDGINATNQEIRDGLTLVKTFQMECRQQYSMNMKKIELTDVQQTIQELTQIDVVREQMNEIEKTRQTKLKAHEFILNINQNQSTSDKRYRESSV